MKISYDNIIYVRKDLKYWQSESENVGFNMELFSKIERGGKGIMPTQVPVFIMSLLWQINNELYWFTSCLLSRFQWLIVQMHISGKYIKWRRLDRQRNRQKYIVIPHQTKINERSNEIYIHMMWGFNPIANSQNVLQLVLYIIHLTETSTLTSQLHPWRYPLLFTLVKIFHRGVCLIYGT